MSSLDDKLREIVKKIIASRQYWDGDITYMRPEELEESVEAVKQAFADEGYRKVFHSSQARKYKNFMASDEPIMTGQEWYNRFDKALDTTSLVYDDNDVLRVIGACVEAAKKAAGIK